MQFRQTKHCGLISQISKMIVAMFEAIPIINQQLDDARIRAEVWRVQREKEHVVYLEKERKRQEDEAYKASLRELKTIMAQWSEDKKLEHFFHEAERDAAMLDTLEREVLIKRLQLARQFLSVESAVERLLKWKTPEELLCKG